MTTRLPLALPTPAPSVRAAAAGYAAPLLVVLGMAMASYSVVRYDLRIVETYTLLAVLLALALARPGRAGWARLGHSPAALALALSALVTVRLHHPFSYLAPAPAATVRWVLAGSALAAATVLLTRWRHAGDAALGLAVAGYVLAGVMLIRLDPAPRIDVWYTLQGAADALAGGHDAYREVWVGPPGIMPAFTYLPWMGALLAPGRWLFGDVRWALLAVTVAGALALRGGGSSGGGSSGGGSSGGGSGGGGSRGGMTGTGDGPGAGGATAGSAAAGALLLMLPGTATQIEQAWTEPVLLACIAGASLALRARRFALAALLLALGMASKQHLALLVPLLAFWPRLGPRRTGLVVGLAGLLVLPWFLAGPAAIWHDTVTLLVNFPPLRFADTLFIAARHELGWTPPFWLTGAVVLATVAAVTWTVRRRNPGVGELLRWSALVLFVANLVNKQAFYNQYWLVAALLLAGWAAPVEAGTTAAGGGADGAGEAGAGLTRPATQPADAAA